MLAPHERQCDPGRITDISRGHRTITTFANEPHSAPKTPARSCHCQGATMSKGGCTGAVYHGRAVGRILRLMPRVKLEEHARYPFSTELEVRVADLNYGAHLGYERLLSLAHQARVRMLDRLGATELD